MIKKAHTSFAKCLSIVALAAMAAFVASCDDSKDLPEILDSSYSIDEATAIVCYDSDLKAWYLQLHIPGSIYAVKLFYPYPKALDKAYRKEGMKVVFTGNAYHYHDYPSNTIVSAEYYRIKLQSVRTWTEEDRVSKPGYYCFNNDFVSLQPGLGGLFLVQARLTDSPISKEEVREILKSQHLQTFEMKNDRFFIQDWYSPEHHELYVSIQYRCSYATNNANEHLFVLPQINVLMPADVSSDVVQEKYGEHLTLAGSTAGDGATLYSFTCDFANSDDVLTLAATIHEEPAVRWCYPSTITSADFMSTK